MTVQVVSCTHVVCAAVLVATRSIKQSKVKKREYTHTHTQQKEKERERGSDTRTYASEWCACVCVVFGEKGEFVRFPLYYYMTNP